MFVLFICSWWKLVVKFWLYNNCYQDSCTNAMKTVNTYKYCNKYKQQISCLDFSKTHRIFFNLHFILHFKYELADKKKKKCFSLTKMLSQPSCELFLQKKTEKRSTETWLLLVSLHTVNIITASVNCEKSSCGIVWVKSNRNLTHFFSWIGCSWYGARRDTDCIIQYVQCWG